MAVPLAPEPTLHVVSQPVQAPLGVLVLPPGTTLGPGLTYVESLAWMLTKTPGSLALIAPGKLTPAGTEAEDLPEPTLSW